VRHHDLALDLHILDSQPAAQAILYLHLLFGLLLRNFRSFVSTQLTGLSSGVLLALRMPFGIGLFANRIGLGVRLCEHPIELVVTERCIRRLFSQVRGIEGHLEFRCRRIENGLEQRFVDS